MGFVAALEDAWPAVAADVARDYLPPSVVAPAGLAPVEAAVASVPLSADFPDAAAEAPIDVPGYLFPADVSFLGSIFFSFSILKCILLF